jgi:hypothetical protein
VKDTQLTTDPKCPCCQATLDGATNIDDSGPSPGDFSLCFYCLTKLRFTDDMHFCKASDSDLEELEPAQRDNLDRLISIITHSRGISPIPE